MRLAFPPETFTSMRRPGLPHLIAAFALVACDRAETRAQSTDTAAAAVPSPEAIAAVGGDSALLSPRNAWLGDTLRPLAPATRAPASLVVDSTVKQGTVIGSNEPATPLCASGLKDASSGVTLSVVRSMQSSFKRTGATDSTMWGRADYRPSDPARFGLTDTQVLRVDCVTHRVLGIAPDITTATR